MNRVARTAFWATIGALSMVSVGCADKRPAKTPGMMTGANAATPPVAQRQGQGDAVVISQDLRAACGIGDAERAPKFAFDSATLRKRGREQLQKLATCLTTGPLAGKQVTLVGRADPRGDYDYNMELGEQRAKSVAGYLADLGVKDSKLSATSRGEMDAQGYDEDTWALDRRVDVSAALARK